MLKYNGKTRYVKAGVWQSNFTGLVTVGGKEYNVYKGSQIYLDMDTSDWKVGVGVTHQNYYDYYGPGKVTWSVSDSSVVKLYSDGSFKGLKEGTATITASISCNGKTIKKSCKVYVEDGYVIHISSGTYDTTYYDYNGYGINETKIYSVKYVDATWDYIEVKCKCEYAGENGESSALKYLIYGSDGNIYDSGKIYGYSIVTGQLWSDTIYIDDLPAGEYTIVFGNNRIGEGYDLY